MEQFLFTERGLPVWLPDETVFSWCSRHHRASARWSHKETGRILFGHARGAISHDLPSRLGLLACNMQGDLGDARAIALAHTVLPVYLPLKPPAIQEAAIEGLCGMDPRGLRFRLGLRTKGLPICHPLKACEFCMSEDIRSYGVAYWHRSHQLPAVWYCPLHERQLSMSSVKCNNERRSAWTLPDDAHLRPSAAPFNSAGVAVARLVTEWTELSAAGLRLEPQQLATAYSCRLALRGLATERTRLKGQRVRVEAAEFLAGVRDIPEFAYLCEEPQLLAQRVARLVAPMRMPSHPGAHLWFIAWLFTGMSDLLTACQLGAPAPPVQSAPPSVDRPVPNARRERFFGLLASPRTTVSAAARECGVDVKTGMTWAATVGIRTPTRPKTLDAERRTRLLRSLRKGMSKGDAANKHDVSQSTVTRVLFTEPGLHEDWVQARSLRKMLMARTRWSRLGRKEAGVKAMREAEPATFAWLYRNDRAWLQAFSRRLDGKR